MCAILQLVSAPLNPIPIDLFTPPFCSVGKVAQNKRICYGNSASNIFNNTLVLKTL